MGGVVCGGSGERTEGSRNRRCKIFMRLRGEGELIDELDRSPFLALTRFLSDGEIMLLAILTSLIINCCVANYKIGKVVSLAK